MAPSVPMCSGVGIGCWRLVGHHQPLLSAASAAAATWRQPVRHGRRWLRPEFRGVYKPKLTPQQMKDFWRTSGLGPERNSSKLPPAVPDAVKRLYPDAAPPMLDPAYRDPIVEAFHRSETMRRRRVLDIPEFYAGSVLAVSVADKAAANQVSRFVGMCVLRQHSGLFSTFTLRNQVDQVSVQIEYELFSPLILEIQLLKLERRLDENLLYLMDAPVHYCSIPFDMVPVPHSKEEPVPINTEKVRLNPPPWSAKWYLHGYQGIDLDDMYTHLDDQTLSKVIENSKAYKRYDLMDQYLKRPQLPDMDYAFKDIFIKHQELLQHRQSERTNQAKADVIDRLRAA